MTKIEPKYILYVYVQKLDKYCKCIEFNTLDKVLNFLNGARKDSEKERYLQNIYYSKRIPRGADLYKYYIRHIETKIESTIIKDEVLKNE